MTNYVVFDLETVPDLDDRPAGFFAWTQRFRTKTVRTAIGQKYARPDQNPRELFLKPLFHRIVCIGAVFAERDHDGPFSVRSIGARHVGEKGRTQVDRRLPGRPATGRWRLGPRARQLQRRRLRPAGAALPGACPRLTRSGLFHGGRRDYWYRFGRDHIDLCDMLSGFGASARPSLNEMAALLGVPAKLDGIDGSKVEAFADAGRLDDIANYCLGDVITSFRLLLRFALVRGEIDEGLLAESEHSLDEAIERQAKQRPSLSAMRRGPKGRRQEQQPYA